MRLYGLLFASMTLFSACGPTVSQGLPNTYRSVRLLHGTAVPPCPAESLGEVRGATTRDLQIAAFQKGANAVVLGNNTEAPRSHAYTGQAIRWMEPPCIK
jgi:hypothetical protein